MRDRACNLIGGALLLGTLVSILALPSRRVCASAQSRAASTNKAVHTNDWSTEVSSAIAHKDYAAARSLLQKVVSAGGDSASDAHYLLGYVLLRQNLPANSLEEYTAGARLRAPAADDLRNVALDYVLLNDYPDAEKWAQRSLEMDQNNPETWYELGRIDYSTGNLNGAYDCFEHSLRLLPDSAKTENNLGLTLEGLNRQDEAVAAYRRAIAAQQNSPAPSEQPLLNLATMLIHYSEFDQALPLLQKAAAIAPASPEVHEQLGKLYLGQNQLTAAHDEMKRAISLSPENASLHFMLGQVCRRSGFMKEAQEEFAVAAHLNGSHSSDKK